MLLNLRLKTFSILFALPVLLCGLPLLAQQTHPIAVGANYTYVRTNLTPDCNCFGLSGGGAEVQFGLNRRLALVGDITAAHRGGVTATHYDLTQVTYTGGLRYLLPASGRVHTFGDLLLGGIHASGSLSPEATGHGGANAFAFEAGGGVGIAVGPRWTLVPARISYLLTTFANGRDDHQNDMRLSIGVRVRVGGS